MDFLSEMQVLRFAGLVAALGAAAIIAGSAVAIERRAPPRPLTHVYTPNFREMPPTPSVGATVAGLRDALVTPRGHDLLHTALPGEGGVLWIALLLALVIAFDFDRPHNPRNIDLIALQALGFCFFGILRFLDVLQSPPLVQLMDWVFTTVFMLSVFLIMRAFWRVNHPAGTAWRPVLSARTLRAVALALVVCNVLIALVRDPDDVGFFVNLGAQRLRERGRLPYGDPLLTGSPGAAYGPLLYVAHLPFQMILAPGGVNSTSPDSPVLGPKSTYFLPPQLATKLCTIAFHLVGVLALFAVAQRLADRAVGWALVALYAGSAYVLGVGGDRYFIGGMTYLSHIAPAAATLGAFAFLHRPAVAGCVLALAAGVGFYPAFMFPAWLGYYWPRSVERWRFASGFLLTAGVIGAGVLLLSQPASGRGLIGTILWDTFGHHTDPRGYGMSPFSFWGQRTGLRGWLMTPLVAGSGFTTPAFLVMLATATFLFVKARGAALHQIALLSAVVAIAASLLKIHPTGTYVAWYYPFLLIGIFCDSSDPVRAEHA